MCRAIIQAHGGDVAAENIKPKGFVVSFYIPAEESTGEYAYE